MSQDRLAKILQLAFVGREEVLNIFRQMMKADTSNKHPCKVLNIYGQNGVGKAWLLYRLQQETREAGGLAAVVSGYVENPIMAMEIIARQFGDEGVPFKDFSERLQRYQEIMNELDDDYRTPRGFYSMLGNNYTIDKARQEEEAQKVARKEEEIYFGDEILADVLIDRPEISEGEEDADEEETSSEETIFDHKNSETALGTLADIWSAHAITELENPDDARLVLKPEIVLTSLFLDQLRTMPADVVVLFFDDHDEAHYYPGPWVQRLVGREDGAIPPILLVIAGQDKLNPQEWNYPITNIQLETFTDDESRTYLERKKVPPEHWEKILNLSDQSPLLMAALTSGEDHPHIAERKITHRSQKDMLEYFIAQVPANLQQAFLNSLMPRFIDREVLEVVSGETDIGDLLEWIQKLPFTADKEQKLVIHPEIREKLLWKRYYKDLKSWGSLQERLVEH